MTECTEPMRSVTQRWCGGAGLRVLRVPAARAGSTASSNAASRILYQCNACRKQTSGHGGNDLRVQQAPAAPLVQVHVSADPIQERRLQSRTWTAAWRHADNRLDPQAQTRPSHDGAQRGQAIKRRRANGRRLYRRQPPRNLWTRRRGENAFRGRRFHDQRWQTRSDRPSPRRQVQQNGDRQICGRHA